MVESETSVWSCGNSRGMAKRVNEQPPPPPPGQGLWRPAVWGEMAVRYPQATALSDSSVGSWVVVQSRAAARPTQKGMAMKTTNERKGGGGLAKCRLWCAMEMVI